MFVPYVTNLFQIGALFEDIGGLAREYPVCRKYIHFPKKIWERVDVKNIH
jgi:hypothetical protein